ncbi:MAG TPA: DoxX family protein [Gemmataceae bacterium]|nr:DoxX family protein [Gemmataceae bacterium]
MNATCQALTALFGRILLSAIFLSSAFGKVMDWSGTAHHMEQEGMVMVPMFLAAAIAFEVLGGLSVLLGLFARYGVWLLIAFMVPTTLIFHDFWVKEGMERMNQMSHFMKNVALTGGLLMVAAFGAGRYSLDNWRAVAADRSVWERRGQSVPVG